MSLMIYSCCQVRSLLKKPSNKVDNEIGEIYIKPIKENSIIRNSQFYNISTNQNADDIFRQNLRLDRFNHIRFEFVKSFIEIQSGFVLRFLLNKRMNYVK